jgi:hypothetical protein
MCGLDLGFCFKYGGDWRIFLLNGWWRFDNSRSRNGGGLGCFNCRRNRFSSNGSGIRLGGFGGDGGRSGN